jgi:hypothetical protein
VLLVLIFYCSAGLVTVCLVVLSALLFSIGDWWAAPLLLVAAATFTAMFYVLRIVQG